MHVLVPSGSVMYPIYVVQANWDSHPETTGYFPFLIKGAYREVDVPTFWRATKGRKYNDVCHGKPVGYAEDEPIPFVDGGQFFPSHEMWSSGPWPECVYSHSTQHYQTIRIVSYSWGNSIYSKYVNCQLRCYAVYFKPTTSWPGGYRYDKYTVESRITIRWEPGRPPRFTDSGGTNEYFRATMMVPVMSALMDLDPDTLIPLGGKPIQRRLILERVDACLGDIQGFVTDEAFLFGFSHMRKDSSSVSTSQCRGLAPPRLPEVDASSQIFCESDVFIDGVDPLVVQGKSGIHYWRQYLISEAYYDACQNVPRLNDNSISNILEIAGFVKGLVIDRKVEIPRSLSDAWLAYRYQYSTGKLDVNEAIKFVHRHMDLQGVNEITSYGQSNCVIDGTDVTCRCCFHISPKDVGTLDRVWRGLYTYGLQPSFYVIWDMIPYSFIVDWLIPIGDIASRLDATRMYSGTYYNITDIQFSLSYDIERDGVQTHWYTRWIQGTPPQMHGVYAFEKSTSMKTTGYRILDALSLVIK